MMNKSYIDYLHLFVLIGFAIAQPIYDLFGKYPEFFVAHSAKPSLIIGMILVLSFGFALVLVLIEIAAHAIDKRWQRVIHLFFVFALAVLIALPLIKKVTILDMLIIGLAGLVGALFTALYARLQAARMFMTILLPVTLIFPLWFVFATPVSRLVLPRIEWVHSEIEIKNPVPVVIVIFDEFSTTALLDSNERIDPIRFPNFVALASEGLWFPNAITVSESTAGAIPAIVTGLNFKPEMKLIPTATDYPNNLFTMLGGHYELYVTETVTKLCPQALNISVRDISSKKLRFFFSDLLVVYGHLIVPPSCAKKLPTLDARWTGFLADAPSAEDDDAQTPDVKDKKKVKTNHKDEILRLFLAQIKSRSKPQLFFIHTELPHVPYSYLASGQLYSNEQKLLPEGIVNYKLGWLGEKPLIITAYHRYLQQVGYVDKFLGTLRDKLISEGIYDDALLIVMADHGVAFEPWQSRRVLNDVNKSEILKIPMFVKIPKQKQGCIDRRIVTSADILPTIIDVIKADVPWKLDGISLTANPGEIRKGFDFVGFGYLSEQVILGFSRLKWQIKYFGERTPFNKLVPKGPFNKLAGCNLAGLQIDEPADMLLISNTIGHFQYVDIGSHFLPSLFSGYIEGATLRNLPIAIAINGKIWLTTNTSKWNEKENFFSVLLPMAALRQGRNIVSLYLIEQKEKRLVLRPINERRKDVRLLQISDSMDTLVFANRKEVAIEKSRDKMDGYLDRLTIEGEMLVFGGWAVDLAEDRPASDILIFKGEKLVWQGVSDHAREDVAKAFKRPSLSQSGYGLSVPLKAFESLAGNVSVIALSSDKRAFRIQIKAEHQELLTAILWEKNIKLQRTSDGKDILVFANRKEVAIEKSRDKMDGYLDRLTIEGEMLVFGGWAVDLVEDRPASDILIFKGEKLVWQGVSDHAREDVVKAFKRPSLSQSGYRVSVPLKTFESLAGNVSAIALSGDKRAFRIHIKDEYKDIINTAFLH